VAVVIDHALAASADPTAVQRLLAYVDQLELQPVSASRGWTHMGAVICDAGLQAGINYTTVVLPRLRRLVELWPAATTTSAFVAQLATDDLGAILQWRGQKKLAVIAGIANVLATAHIETPAQLAAIYADSQAAMTLSSLRRVKGVGPKTIDYLAILVGSSQHVAIDQHLRGFARDAGIADLTYDGLRTLYAAAAHRRGWRLGDLDAAIWRYQANARHYE
jgi:hypothetical protein